MLFNRVALTAIETAKFTRASATGELGFTIAENDTSIQSITVSGDGTKVSVTVVRTNRKGGSESTVVASDIADAATLKKALEYEGTLINVSVPDGYIASITSTVSDTYAPVFDAFSINLTNEIAYFSNVDTVNVAVLMAPLGTVIEIGAADLQAKKEKYDAVNLKLQEVATARGDCMVLFDYPIDLSYDDALEMFKADPWTSLDTDQLCVAYPAVKVASSYTGEYVEASSSMIFAGQMAYTDRVKGYRDWETDRKSTRLNSSHSGESRMPSSA